MMPGVTTNMTTPGQDQDYMGRVARSAYLMVKGSVAEDLVTREELLEALQCAGECYCYLQYIVISCHHCCRLQPDTANHCSTLAPGHHQCDILSVLRAGGDRADTLGEISADDV